MKGDESKSKDLLWGTPHIFYVGKDVAAKCTREGDGHAEEGGIINLLVVSAMRTDFSW